MKKNIFGALILFSCLAANAQVSEKSEIQIKAANVQFGLFTANSAISNLSDFQKLAPNSDFQESDVDGFKAQNNFFGSSGPAFSLNLVLAQPTNEKAARLNTEFRFGISFQQADVFNLSYGRTDNFRVDTLTSSRNGDQTFVDSVYSQDYYLSYTQNQVMIDADVTISTNPNKRFKFYGGIGLSLGLSVAPSTTISYNTTSSLEQIENQFETFYNESEYDGKSENFRNEAGFFGRIYVPLGVDFRIGKTSETAKKYHMFLESRTSLMFQSVPELSLITNTGNVTALGLRYDF